MSEEIVATVPVGAATPVEPVGDTRERSADGKFVSKETPPQASEPSATADADKPAPESDADAPQKRNRVKERIDTLTAEKHAALREAQALRSRLEALDRQAPRQVDSADYDGQQREQFRSVIREETKAQTVEQYQAAINKAHEAQRDSFYAKVDAARERIPNIDAAIRAFSELTISDHAAEIIAESDKAAEIALYLSENPREAHEISFLSPAKQGRALALIEQRYSLPSKRTSSAPPPPPGVIGATAAAPRRASEMSVAEMQSSLKKSGVLR